MSDKSPTPTPVETLMSPQPVTVHSGDTLSAVLQLLLRYPFRHLPVVDDERLVGMVSDRDLCLAGGWASGSEAAESDLDAITVRDVMTESVESTHPDAPATEAAQRLVDRRIGALPVLHDGVCVGILTATDLLRDLRDLCAAERDASRRSREERVIWSMSTKPVTVQEDATVSQAARLAHESGVRHLPVLDSQGVLTGILSDRDLRRAMAAEALAEACADLEGYEPPAGRLVRQDMTRGLLVLAPDAALATAAGALAENRVGALPVVEDGELCGVLTESDLLERYIALARA